MIEILKIDPREQIYNLVYFDWTAFIILVYACLIILILLFWRPVKSGKESKKIKGLSVWAFLIAILALSYCTLLLPFTLFKIGKPFILDIAPVIQKQLFVRQSFVLAFFLSIGLADCFLGQIKRSWLKIIYLFVPFPLLWWNLVRDLFPSRYWTLWKAPLAVVSFAPAFLAFFTEPQEIREFQPLERAPLERVAYENLDQCVGYQIQPAPDGNALYVNCSNVLTRFEKDSMDWKKTGQYDPKGQWDEAAFSFLQDECFIYLGEQARLDIVDLKSMTKLDSVTLDRSLFSQRHPGTHQVYSQEKNLLVIAENFGVVQVLDRANFKQLASVDMARPYCQIWRILLDDSKDELYVLQDHAMWVLRVENLKILRHLEFEDSAIDMHLDASSGFLYISFPKIMEVHRYETTTLQRVDRIPAPASVRAIVVDRKSNRIVTGSYNGVISVRDLENHRLVSRFRVTPYLRRIKLLQDEGRLLVSFANYKVLTLPYSVLDTSFDFTDWVLLNFERAYRLTTMNTGDEKTFH